MSERKLNRSPWAWVSTLYFAEGIPYYVVNVISVTMFKRLGMSNGDLAMYTSLLYLPWVIKPLWSPFVDVLKTKRWWVLAMQMLITAGFAALALSIGPGLLTLSLICFYIVAFASATHDIAADGFYMIALPEKEQSLFVGIRSTFYRIASVFGQGVLVVLAGVLEQRTGDIPLAWSLTIGLACVMFAVFTLWHFYSLPPETHVVEADSASSGVELKEVLRNFGHVWAEFFRKDGVWLAIVFMLLYRLPEAFSVKMLTPFLLDSPSAGGLGLSTADSGLVYGTMGVAALTVGGILGGIFAAHKGLRRSLWPMSLALALPCAVYLYMAAVQPSQLWIVYLCVAFDQFGYGFGFTAYMLYMMHFSEGEYKTSHYAICTAFMALSMMIPGFFAGWIQEVLGYVGFFIIVMICCLATVFVTFFARRRC